MTSPLPRANAPTARALAFCLFLFGVFLRCPPILLHGRVWAEESSTYLAANWHLSFWQILVAPRLGYFSLWSNAWAAVAVRFIPLEFVSYLFTGASLLVLLAVQAFVFEAEFLPTRAIRLAGVAALLFTTGSTESWLNLINAQFYFALLAGVILASATNRLVWQRALALALAVLSSPVAALLAPLFAWRAARERTRTAWLQAAVVGAGAALQAAVALLSTTGNRTLQFHPSELGPILLNKDAVFPLLGRPAAMLAGKAILHAQPASVAVCWLLLGAVAGGAVLLFRRQRTAMLLCGMALWLGTCQALLALGGGLLNVQPGYGERYALAPNCLLLLALLAGAAQVQMPTRRRWTQALLGLAFVAGFVDYLWLPLRVRSNYNAAPWHAQALRWERDETIPLQPNPNGWSLLRLPHRH